MAEGIQANAGDGAEIAKRKLLILTPHFPPMRSGIGDYVHRLTLAARERADLSILVASGGKPTPSRPGWCDLPWHQVSIRPRSRGTTLPDIVDQLAGTGPDSASHPVTLLVQFEQFMWGRWGWCPWLPLALRQVKRRRPDVQLAVMFHERFVAPVNWKFRVMHLWQRRQYEALRRLADQRLYSIRRWADDDGGLHLPVSSNLPILEQAAIGPTVEAESMGEGGPLRRVGLFGSKHDSHAIALSVEAAIAINKAAPGVRIRCVGAIGRVLRAKLEQAGGPSAIVEDHGYLDAQKAAETIASCDLMLAPFDYGLSTRRGSAIAALSLGVPLLSTRGIETDPMLLEVQGKAFLLAEPRDYAEFAAKAAADPVATQLAKVGREGQRFYASQLDWPVHVDRLLSLLTRVTSVTEELNQ